MTRLPKIRWHHTILGHPSPSWNRLLRSSPCSYCGHCYHWSLMTVDHIRPQGPWKRSNKRKIIAFYQDYGDINFNTTSACKRCNQAKGSRELLQFMLTSAA